MAGPTVRRLQLGIELRRLREAADVTPQEAADALKCSRARISHIEKGRNVLSYAELFKLLKHHYGADDVTVNALETLREEASQKGWWSPYGLPEWLAGYVGLEYDAISIRALELEMIPGLLQTQQYAAAQYSLDDRWSARDVERRVAVRMERQQRLVGTSPMQLAAVVSEAALVRCARHPSVAAAQLARLVERAQWSNIELRVLPFDVGLHVGAAGPFSLLTFPDQLLADAAYQEYAVGGDVIDDQSVVSRLARLFGKLRSQALGVDESLALIAELAGNTR
jgi:transcriptional regulator with XRE-family HTH domain